MTILGPKSMSDKETKWVFYPPPPKLRELSFSDIDFFDVVPYNKCCNFHINISHDIIII